MLFCELQNIFLETLRAKVRNGETTERALARIVGISQPHLHNVLAGKRNLTPELMDRCLYQLRLSVLDLVDRATLARFLDSERPEPGEHTWLPVLRGKIGPTSPWPSEVEQYARFPVRAAVVREMWHPVVARTTLDLRMYPLLTDGDHLLLDQSLRGRMNIEPGQLYVIKLGNIGYVRRLHNINGQVFLVTEDTRDRPGLWEKLPVDSAPLMHFVRARATLILPELEWTWQSGGAESP